MLIYKRTFMHESVCLFMNLNVFVYSCIRMLIHNTIFFHESVFMHESTCLFIKECLCINQCLFMNLNVCLFIHAYVC